MSVVKLFTEAFQTFSIPVTNYISTSNLGYIARVHFWKFWNYPSGTRAISKFSKIKRVIYPKHRPNQTCSYWLITPNHQTLRTETNIFWQPAIANQRPGNYKTAGNYKANPLTVQCWLQSTVWLILKVKINIFSITICIGNNQN